MAQDGKNPKSDEEISLEAEKIKNDFLKKLDKIMKEVEEIKIKDIKDKIN